MTDTVSSHPQPFPYQPAVAPKNPALALLCSFFIPGLGSLIIGRVGMGVLIFSLYVISLVLIIVLIGAFTAPIVWIWGMVDAYSGAKKWNTAHGIVS